ncbi:MinD-like ATPase involved in chromosome partitioning or flagellar assembly [Streptosporangium album]|uniref:MinD-like ATPase involved in chromosome partitioning or flagellar assembly n=1 Tax=Streptosporangium album TaxID=47479 RepID=A0A7W7W7N4_9ACTN|nr:TcpE family conjugal transfer membrane protein [Streptosporangium album]MBB4937497.1 MinD-like ATPase involved in chromosome partitioning or flagellar assembly [Streptosporangium album]
MDLPTYTNIWRIEKRLYKLYDLRLPMPLPIVWIGVFVGVVVPWSLLLYLLGLPLEAPWHVVYLVPPGIVTWLSTRPVIESKRLTELLQSQLRYVGEPRTWCRMAPTSEPSEISLTGRVWRAAPQRAAPVRVKSSRRARHAQAKRAASSRQVRPAVAAAAAAAAAGPAAREQVAWGTAPAPRRGTAPALGQATAETPGGGTPAVSVPETPVERVFLAPPPMTSGARVKAQADPAPAMPPAPVSATGSERAPAAPAAPIDTEALRRLRRLAASAEAERATAPPPAQPERPVSAERSVPADRPVSAGRSVSADRLVSAAPPSVDRPLPAERSAPTDRSPAAAEHAEQSPATPRFVGPAPTGRRPATPRVKADESPAEPETGRDEDPWARYREDQPGAQAAETRRARPQERPAGTPPGISIRAVPSGAEDKADPVTPAVALPKAPQGEARVRRVESVVGRDSSGGWRRLAQVVIGPGGTGRMDGAEVDEARARAVFNGSRRVVVLGCTGGAGQTTTALMLGHTLARYREDRVLAVDAGVGIHALSSRIQGESPETLTSLLAGLDNVHGYLGMRAYTSRCASGLEVIAGDSDSGAEQRLSDRTLFSDRRLSQTMDMLDRHYKLIVMDPAAALAARVLPYADQLVLVVPASQDGPDAVAMTYEWLDGHGCADLRRRAIMVVNGVSRRSMGDVEQAEAVARGRCRAIVRVPWEDELAPDRSERVEPSHLRAAGRRAYLALAGVVVAGFGAAQAVRSSEEELAQ